MSETRSETLALRREELRTLLDNLIPITRKRVRACGVTLHDVAKAAGVATSTASRALRGSPEISEETRFEGAQDRRQIRVRGEPHPGDSFEAGAFSCRDGRRQRDALSIPFKRCCREFKHAPTLTTSGSCSWARAPQSRLGRSQMPSKRLRALFIMPRGSSPLIEQCRFHGLPIAVAARSREQLLPQHVDIAVHADEARVAALIVDHLLEHGHRSIAFAAVDDGNRMMETRADELKKALTKRGLPVHPEWFFMRALKMADQLIAACRREDGPTAIVCGSDFVALQIVHVLREAELAIPGDVSVVGVHNHDFVNFLSPPITTVDIGLEEIGYQAALQLLDYAMRPNNRPSIDITLEPRLVVRSSVAPV